MTSYPTRYITADQARAADHKAAHVLGVPTLVLMENAAKNAAAVACDMLTTFDLPAMQSAAATSPASVGILAGSGNNAGDGYALARHLQMAGHEVTLYAMRDIADLKGDAAINAGIARKLGIPIHLLRDQADIAAHASAWESFDLLVDAMLGTGFCGEVRSPILWAIERCNHTHDQGVSVLALDVPSGLNADTGHAGNMAIHADVTATFLAMKKGFEHLDSLRYTGKVVVCDIGVPARWLLED